MTIKSENRIWTELSEVLNQALSERDISGLTIEYAAGPLESPGIGPAIIVYKIAEQFTGSHYRSDVVNHDGLLQHEENYLVELTFRLTAVKRRDPDNDTEDTLTAADILQALAAWLMSAKGIKSLQILGYGLLPIKELRQPYLLNERGEYQLTPHFDFTVCIKQSFREPIAEIEDKLFTIIPI